MDDEDPPIDTTAFQADHQEKQIRFNLNSNPFTPAPLNLTTELQPQEADANTETENADLPDGDATQEASHQRRALSKNDSAEEVPEQEELLDGKAASEEEKKEVASLNEEVTYAFALKYSKEDIPAMVEARELQKSELLSLKYSLTKNEVSVKGLTLEAIEDELDEIKPYFDEEELTNSWMKYFEDQNSPPPAELEVTFRIMPTSDFSKIRVNLANSEFVDADEFPVMNMVVTLPWGYQARREQPKVHIQSRVFKELKEEISVFLERIFTELNPEEEADSDCLPVLYEWYLNLKDNFITECLSQLPTASAANDELILNLPGLTKEEFVDGQIETKLHVLDQTYTVCQICFEEFLGSQHFLILNPCRHALCLGCMLEFCKDKIKDGLVDQLKCPITAEGKTICGSHIREKDLHQLNLPEEIMSKFQKFSVQKAVDAMDDFGWCPRCDQPAELDKQKNRGHCTICGYIFCMNCGDTYHMFKRCEKNKITKTQVKDTIENMENDIRDKERKRINVMNEVKSLSYLKHCTKACPNCKVAVSKIDGCNKMTCQSCHSHFCWSCLTVIKGYDHFNDNPVCWGILEAAIAEELPSEDDGGYDYDKFENALRAMINQEVEEFCVCPEVGCGFINKREERNNDIRCQSCHIHFCYTCNRVICEKGGEGDRSYLRHFDYSDCYHIDLSK